MQGYLKDPAISFCAIGDVASVKNNFLFKNKVIIYFPK